MLSVAFSRSSSSYLTPQMEARTGQPPPSACPEYIVFFFKLPPTWSGSRLPVCVPISLSSCLFLFTAVSFMLGRPSPPPPPPPQSSHHSSDTNTHTQETPTRDYSTLPLVHPPQVALPVPALSGAPVRTRVTLWPCLPCRLGAGQRLVCLIRYQGISL